MKHVLSLRRRRFPISGALKGVGGAIDLASIMVGVIVIGVIAGIIAATVFVVIPWSQDEAAKGSLDAVRTAESVSVTMDDPGQFLDWAGLRTAGRIQPSSNIAVTVGTSCYIAASKSVTGTTFYTTNKGPQIVNDKAGAPTFSGCDAKLPVVGVPVANAASCPTFNQFEYKPATGTSFNANCTAFPVINAAGVYLGQMGLTYAAPAVGNNLPALFTADYSRDSRTAATTSIEYFAICRGSNGVYAMGNSMAGGVGDNSFAPGTCATTNVGGIVASINAPATNPISVLLWSSAGGVEGFAPGIIGPSAPFGVGESCPSVAQSTYVPDPHQAFYANCSEIGVKGVSGADIGDAKFALTQSTPGAVPTAITVDFARYQTGTAPTLSVGKICQASDATYSWSLVISGGAADSVTTVGLCPGSTLPVGLAASVDASGYSRTFFLWSKQGGTVGVADNITSVSAPFGAGVACPVIAGSVAKPNPSQIWYAGECGGFSVIDSSGLAIGSMSYADNASVGGSAPTVIDIIFTKTAAVAVPTPSRTIAKLCSSSSGDYTVELVISGSLSTHRLAVASCTGGSSPVAILGSVDNTSNAYTTVLWSKWGAGS